MKRNRVIYRSLTKPACGAGRMRYWASAMLIVLSFAAYGFNDQLLKRKCQVGLLQQGGSIAERHQIQSEDILVIPVVIHVVYQNEIQNISLSQIQSQLAVLNQDFRMKNQNATNTVSEFSSLAADSRIEFELARTNVLGESVDGITRTETNHSAFANNDLHNSDLGGVDQWDEEKYLNIWVADLANGIIGYASQPTMNEAFDGVAIHYENFGTEGTAVAPYHLGRTLTHEVGHWLGLNHTWGDGDCSSDDGISDTPNQQSSSSGCDLSKTSCESLDMVQNFMDLSDDECMTLFTEEQAAQMRTTLFTNKPNLYSPKPILGSVLSNLAVNTIRCIYSNGIMKISLASFQTGGELTVYNLSGRSLFQKWMNDAQKEIRIELGSGYQGVNIVRYRTVKGSFSTKFINKG